MQERILSLTEQFISIRSDQINRAALKEILNLALLNLKGYTIEKFERNGVCSALVYNTSKRPDKFTVLFNIHLDVIPGKKEQYTPRIEGDKLYGTGSMDMKGNAACAILAFAEVAKNIHKPIALQLVTDEEVGGFDGTQYQVENGVRSNFVIATEPTNFDIVNKAKGVLWIKITSQGKTAHGAYPWRGDNAIWKMHDFLSRLKEAYPIPVKESWITTVNLSSIESKNTVYNKIPDECTVCLDVRFIPEDTETILTTIQALLPKGSTTEVITHEPALDTNKENSFVKILKKISEDELKKNVTLRPAQGTSDARHFARVGCPGIEFGPIGGGIGSDNEWIDIPSLNTYYNILLTFLNQVDQ